jgi:hypothetical protein
MVEATQSYRERMKAQRAELRAKREAHRAEPHRRIVAEQRSRLSRRSGTKVGARSARSGGVRSTKRPEPTSPSVLS